MLKMWHNLKKRFYLTSQIDPRWRYVELIAMLFFWAIYIQYLKEHEHYQEFKSFFGLDEMDGV